MFDFSISSQVRRGGFSIAGGRPSRLNGSVKGVRIKNIPPLSQLKPKITLMAALARSWAAGSKKKGICKSRCLSFWQDTRIQNPWAVYSLPDQFPTGYLAGGAFAPYERFAAGKTSAQGNSFRPSMLKSPGLHKNNHT